MKYSVEYHTDRGTVQGPQLADFGTCVRWAAQGEHVSGPTGPVAYAVITRADGSRVDGWFSECERLGLDALVITDYAGRERVVDAVPMP
jgi:hypothetical protein